jgi:hypothetical protein
MPQPANPPAVRKSPSLPLPRSFQRAGNAPRRHRETSASLALPLSSSLSFQSTSSLFQKEDFLSSPSIQITYTLFAEKRRGGAPHRSLLLHTFLHFFALFCRLRRRISHLFKQIHTLCTKHRGVGRPAHASRAPFASLRPGLLAALSPRQLIVSTGFTLMTSTHGTRSMVLPVHSQLRVPVATLVVSR